MKKTKTVIRISKPCLENWDSMTPAEKGRHCMACQKTVVDFSRLTDAEIIGIIDAGKDAPQCGRFHYSQVDRELIDAGRNYSFSSKLLKKIAASLLFFQTIATNSWSQNVKPATGQHTKSRSDATKEANPRVISGRIVDDYKNEKLKGITVYILGTDIKAVTDKSGRFRMSLPDTFSARHFWIQADYVRKKHDPWGIYIHWAEVDLDKMLPGREVTLYRLREEHKMGIYNGD